MCVSASKIRFQVAVVVCSCRTRYCVRWALFIAHSRNRKQNKIAEKKASRLIGVVVAANLATHTVCSVERSPAAYLRAKTEFVLSGVETLRVYVRCELTGIV